MFCIHSNPWGISKWVYKSIVLGISDVNDEPPSEGDEKFQSLSVRGG